MKLEIAIKYMNADSAALDPALLECEVGSFAIDSREIERNGLFFALSQPEYKTNGFNGEFDDSTRFSAAALNAGALAAVVRPDRFEEHKELLGPFFERLIFVEDVIKALQGLARGVYHEWNKPVVAITGSAGKTTAKEITAHVLSYSGLKILRNKKNYNNGLGHPLTVLGLVSDRSFDAAVLEMGMSTPLHEIARLCTITPPDVAVELNVYPVHIEHLGSIENIAKAKAELVEGMKPGGVAILNADDERVAAMRSKSKGRTLTFGIKNPADVSAKNIRPENFQGVSFTLCIGAECADVKFPLNGIHNIMNALAAAAVASTFDLNVNEIAAALGTVEPPMQRGEVLRFAAGFTVINDSYNSNPDALLSMVSTLADGSQPGERKIVVAGEMLELGADSDGIHREVGNKLASAGVDVLFAVRGAAKEMAAGAAEAGLAGVLYFEDSEAAGHRLCDEVRSGDVVLVKGSRGVRTERVVEKLLERFDLQA